MFMELSQNLHALVAGKERYKMRLYVGHDGSMIRLASGLGIGRRAPLRWPALGSEIVMEVRTARQPLFERPLACPAPIVKMQHMVTGSF